MGIAALVTGYAPYYPAWQLRSTSGGVGPVTFPATILRIRVEILVNGTWVDVSSYVKYEEKIRITRGRMNQRGEAPAQTCRLTFRNADKRFSRRNTTSPYYPFLGQGTKLRVFFNPGSGDSLRFTGEVPDWTPLIPGHPNARTVTIEASGKLRREERGTQPTKSAWRRYIEGRVVQPIAYWTLEDVSGSITGASATVGVGPMIASGGSVSSPGVRFGEGTTRSQPKYTSFEVAPVATLPLASLGDGGVLAGTWPVSTVSPVAWTVQFVGRIWAFTGIAGSDLTLARWFTPGGTFARWDLRQTSLDAFFTLVGVTAAGAETTVITLSGLAFLDLVEIIITGSQQGTDVATSLQVKRGTSDGGSGLFATDLRAGTLGQAISWVGNPNRKVIARDPISGSENQINDIVVGHVRIYDVALPGISALDQPDVLGEPGAFNAQMVGPNGDFISPWMGYVGERPTDRFARTCGEEDVAYVIGELVADGELMGLQTPDTFMGNLRKCEETSEGLIDETRAGELRLSSRTARWVPNVPLAPDYAHSTYGNQVFRIRPTDDDFATRNDWTITREGGSSGRAVQTTGPLNVNERENDNEGVGRRDDSKTLNLLADAQALQHAHWRLSKSTVDEPRYPSIKLALHRNPELIPGWLDTDVNGRLRVSNPPADVGTDAISQFVEGYVEEATQVTWEIEVNGSPAATEAVGRYGDYVSRYGCAGSTLTSAIDTTTTSLALTITDRCVWAHTYGDYHVLVGGEEMTVTAAAAATGTYPAQAQVLTVTRSVNGAVLTHAAGTPVRLKPMTKYAL